LTVTVLENITNIW